MTTTGTGTGGHEAGGRAGGGADEAAVADGADGADGADEAAGPTGGEAERWSGVERALLRMRRVVLLSTLVPLAVGLAALLWAVAGPAWACFALLPAAVAVWGWGALERNWRSWRYAERADDLLISRGVLWRELTVVPYGRMQLVEVTSGPLERRYGLARVQLHTAAATTDAAIPGLVPDEAERLRDRLTELGGARSAGL